MLLATSNLVLSLIFGIKQYETSMLFIMKSCWIARELGTKLGTSPHGSGALSSQFPLSIEQDFNMAVSLCFLRNSEIICSVLVAFKCMKVVLSGLQGSI